MKLIVNVLFHSTKFSNVTSNRKSCSAADSSGYDRCNITGPSGGVRGHGMFPSTESETKNWRQKGHDSWNRRGHE